MQDAFLERLLNGSTFWRPRMLDAATVAVQAIVLGPEPPRCTGIKALASPHPGGGTSGGGAAGATPADEALLEASFAWNSKLEAKLLVTLLGGPPRSRLRSLLSPASRVRVRPGGTPAGARAAGCTVSPPLPVSLQAPGAQGKALPRPSPVPQVSVSNLAATGTIRLALRPLLDELPVAGGVKVRRLAARLPGGMLAGSQLQLR